MNTTLKYNGIEIHFNDDKMVNLTSMWRACGRSANRTPQKWMRQESTQSFLKSLKKISKGDLKSLLESKMGRYGGTYAHWQIALAYAKYLNPEFHIWCNKAIRSHCEEEADPGLKLERARDAYRKKGYSDEWIAQRLFGKETRNEFTSMLKDHGANGKDYGVATGKINRVILGGLTSTQYRKQMGLAKGRTRDGLSKGQLAVAKAIETLAIERVEALPGAAASFNNVLGIVDETAKAFKGVLA